jgi:hypothetical protein
LIDVARRKRLVALLTEAAELATSDVIPVPLRGISLAPTSRIYDIQLVPVTDVASAQAVVAQIIEEGEGTPENGAGSHFHRFLAILAEPKGKRGRSPDFDPARPVTAHPRTQASRIRAHAASAGSSTTPTARSCCC